MSSHFGRPPKLSWLHIPLAAFSWCPTSAHLARRARTHRPPPNPATDAPTTRSLRRRPTQGPGKPWTRRRPYRRSPSRQRRRRAGGGLRRGRGLRGGGRCLYHARDAPPRRKPEKKWSALKALCQGLKKLSRPCHLRHVRCVKWRTHDGDPRRGRNSGQNAAGDPGIYRSLGLHLRAGRTQPVAD